MAVVKKVQVLINGETKVDGKNTLEFIDLNLQQQIFGHHTLEIVYPHFLFEKQDSFILEKSDALFLGSKISVIIEGAANNKLEFNGVITGIRASKKASSKDYAVNDTITIIASSPDIFLDDGEHCRTFENLSLKAIVDKIFTEYGIENVKVKPVNANESLPYTVQYKESAYAFLSRLATKKSQWFYYDGKNLFFGAREQGKITLEYGLDLFYFDFSLKLEDLNFKYVSYDYLINKVISSESMSMQELPNLSKKGKVAYDVSKDKFRHETLSLYNHYLAEGNEEGHLKSRVKQVKNSIASGFIACSGSSDHPGLTLGCEIKLTETLYNEDNQKKIDHGSYIITSLSHSLDGTGVYQNSFMAVPAEIEVPPYTTPHAIPICETQVAKVVDNADPKQLGRVRVQFIWQEPDHAVTPWLRTVSPHAGKDKGFYFIPELKEQVMVAFEGGNAEKPYVIGSMFHGEEKPDSKWVNDTAGIKAIRTLSGHTIEFCDLDGEEKIKIYDKDKENYVITLDSHSSKIMIQSKGDLEMEAKGDLKIKAKNISMESSQDMNLKGTSVKNEASGKMEIKASSMKIDGGANLEQSGGIVKIN